MTDREFLQKLDALRQNQFEAEAVISKCSGRLMTLKDREGELISERCEARCAQDRIAGQIQELLKSRPLPAQPDEIETSAPSWAELGLKESQ